MAIISYEKRNRFDQSVLLTINSQSGYQYTKVTSFMKQKLCLSSKTLFIKQKLVRGPEGIPSAIEILLVKNNKNNQ